MNLHNRAIQTDRLDLDTDELLLLQLLEHPIEHAALRPAIHARIDRVPVAEPLRQSAPLTAVLGYVENRVDHLEIVMRDVAAVSRPKRLV